MYLRDRHTALQHAAETKTLKCICSRGRRQVEYTSKGRHSASQHAVAVGCCKTTLLQACDARRRSC